MLQQSLLVSPSQIDARLAAAGEPDGWHRIVYDGWTSFVFSEAKELSEVKAEDLARKIRVEIERRSRPLDAVLRDVYLAIERHREIRVRPTSAEAAGDAAYVMRAPHAPELAPGPERLHAERSRRYSEFRAKAASETDARFAALGLEAWAMGSQLVAVTLPKKQG